MNLGKLLRAGTSIFGGGEEIAYRLSKGGALPKFNEGKSPFGLKASGEPEPVKAEVKTAPVVAPAQKAPPPYAFKPALSQDSDVRRQAVAAPVEKPSKQGWTTRLNPFRAPEPPAAQAPRPVQAELSLDAVKVVHNDLADADVEVVPVKSNTDATVSAPILPPARRAWEYLGESLLRG
jgi:hypothetical protein